MKNAQIQAEPDSCRSFWSGKQHIQVHTPEGQKCPVVVEDTCNQRLQCCSLVSGDAQIHFWVNLTIRLIIFRKYWLACTRVWETAVYGSIPVSEEFHCREHPEGISLDKANEYPWVYLSPLPEKMGCCQDSFPLLCWKPPCFSTAAVSGCPISWDTSFSHITVLALRCCGTCLRRQLVIKLEREGLWVLAFGSCPQWLTFYHSFSLWQGALHLLAVTVLGAAAEALTRIGHQQGSSTGSPPGKLIQIKQRCKADLPAVIKHSS